MRSGYAAMLKEVQPLAESFSATYPFPHELLDDISVSAEVGAIYYGFNLFIAMELPEVRKFTSLCRILAEKGKQAETSYCFEIAHKLQKSSDTWLVRALGYRLEIEMLKADDPADARILSLMRKKKISYEVMNCLTPDWGSTLEEILSNSGHIREWMTAIAQYGEIEGTRRIAEKAYLANSQISKGDPKLCEAVWELEEADWAELLGDKDPEAQWLEELDRSQ